MKKTFLTFIILLVVNTFTFAQDIITTSSNVIFNTKVLKVDGDKVTYMQNDSVFTTRATSITIDGSTINLNANNNLLVNNQSNKTYKGHDAFYYRNLIDRSRTQRNIGIVLTSVGITGEVIGLVMMGDNNYNNDNAGAAIYLISAISSTVGIPLWISGAIKLHNNEKALEFIVGTNGVAVNF